jgi:hypothetical protein
VRGLGDRAGEAAVLDHLGDTQEALGDPAAARRSWRAALDILHETEGADADRISAKLR